MSAVSSASEDEAYEALQCARARIEYLERHQKELITQRDELLRAIECFNTAIDYVITAIARVKGDAS